MYNTTSDRANGRRGISSTRFDPEQSGVKTPETVGRHTRKRAKLGSKGSDEVDRQNSALQLIASENFASPAVMAATGSVFTNKYSEGYPGKRYYGGNQGGGQVEDLARDRGEALVGADHANVQPHPRANANMGG